MSPDWPAIVGVICAAWLVLILAVWARPARGRHRRTAGTWEVTDLATGVRFRRLVVVPDLPAVSPQDYEYDIDDWTADLPTHPLQVVTDAVTDADLAEIYHDVSLAAGRFAAETRRHTSPSETAAATARRRWGVECPIFKQLADDYAYHPVHGFDRRAVA